MSEPEDLYKRTQEGLFDSILSRVYDWYSEDDPLEELQFYGEDTDLPLLDETDKEILMHRDAHFSSSFSAMIDYYRDPEAKGINENIGIERIIFLEKVQQGLKKDLAPILIGGRDAEKVAIAKKMYRELAEVSTASSPEGKLAEALLSEKSVEESVEELLPIVANRPEMLTPLACSEYFSDPLFPSYGTGAKLAVVLLGRLRYEKAIEPLFHLIGSFSDFSTETAVLHALRQMGEPVRTMAMKKAASLPLTKDNERAVLILMEFLPDEEITELFRHCLKIPGDRDLFRSYLSLGLEGK